MKRFLPGEGRPDFVPLVIRDSAGGGILAGDANSRIPVFKKYFTNKIEVWNYRYSPMVLKILCNYMIIAQ
ncbi:hypothetical protein FACS1894155_06410 [Bacteroidia bacterium]|nr:hypothetical protein FACS189455_0440 [Bacteroidia bacterium]GHU89437.1 hypothetical protein FACS1894155_06410 [Bacteroidia bacterium]